MLKAAEAERLILRIVCKAERRKPVSGDTNRNGNKSCLVPCLCFSTFTSYCFYFGEDEGRQDKAQEIVCMQEQFCLHERAE